MPYSTTNALRAAINSVLIAYSSRRRGPFKLAHYDRSKEFMAEITHIDSKEKLIDRLFEFYLEHLKICSQELAFNLAIVLGEELMVNFKEIEIFFAAREYAIKNEMAGIDRFFPNQKEYDRLFNKEEKNHSILCYPFKIAYKIIRG